MYMFPVLFMVGHRPIVCTGTERHWGTVKAEPSVRIRMNISAEVTMQVFAVALPRDGRLSLLRELNRPV